MNEHDARAVTLVRAIETTEQTRPAWSDDDREWAGRAAAEVVGSTAPADVFLARRAALAIERLSARQAGVPRLLAAFAWRPWVGWVLPAVALALGMATDRLGPDQRVDVLAFPLLALMAWNLAMYVVLAVRALARLAAARRGVQGPLRRAVARLGRVAPKAVPGGLDGGPLGTAAAVYGADWARLAAPLWVARIARTLHLSAALLAVGAIAGMYLRGIVHEYRAGWDSTFLDAEAVARLLSVALAPGAALTGIALPDAARLEAMRFGTGGAGENAADWIHLYAATVGAVVIVPRLLLALYSRLVEGWRTARFALPLEEPYFQRLLRTLHEAPVRVRVIPYSYQPSEAARRGVEALLMRVFGPRTTVVHASTVAYGDETAPAVVPPGAAAPNEPATSRSLLGGLALGGRGVPTREDEAAADTLVALFALSATPEDDNHGAFLASLSARSGAGSPPAAIVDESGFRTRFAQQPQRIDERREAWRRVLAAQHVEPVFVDLGAADAADAAPALDAALHRRAPA